MYFFSFGIRTVFALIVMAGSLAEKEIPPGMVLPPGIKIPPGYKIPPGMKLPPGYKLPDGYELPTEAPVEKFVDLVVFPNPLNVHIGRKLEVSIVMNETVQKDDKIYAKVNFTGCYWSTVTPSVQYLTFIPKTNIVLGLSSAEEVLRYGGEPALYLAGNVSLSAQKIGHCRLALYECDLPEMSLNEHLCQYYDVWKRIGNETLIKVFREEKALLVKIIYKCSTLVTIFIAYFCMGCMMKLTNIVEDLRRPIGPVLGYVAQYVFIPVAAFSFGKLMRINPSYRVGLFVVGIVPSAWTTKAWVLLFEGDVTFSLMITTINTVMSFGMIPFWISILTNMTTEDHEYFESLKIPWLYLGYTFFVVIGPTGLGFALQRTVQRFMKRKLIEYVSTPFKILLAILLVYNVALTIWYFYDVIFMIEWRMSTCAAMFVASGFLCGLLIGILARRNSTEITVIAIEAGIHNIYLARLILDESLEEPENDVSSLVGIPVYVISHAFLLMIYIVKSIRGLHTKSKIKRGRPLVHVLRSASFPEDTEVAIQLMEVNGNASTSV